ncbi:pentraxin-related protein PTX3 [Microcaecilia unicolor]|uniref:Pentraxin-related protein PTX3 n=1 Tax=Microcaecilia unicolor TaxID=1415580 RepID=A0A6P7Z6J4_9AMPH|nr:pentraxin-related protein PTX3 [Microcaecilia unicolor]
MNMLKVLFCILCSFSSVLTSDYDIIYTSYDNDFENEIHPAEEESAPTSNCPEERTTWDKIFIMLENSQMKQNIMLQSIDEILKVELQSLRTEMTQFVAKLAGTCSSNVMGATSQIVSKVNRMLTNISQIQCPETSQQPGQANILKEIFLLNQNISKRLSKLENMGERVTEAVAQETAFQPQDKTTSTILSSLLKELQQTRAELHIFQRQATQHSLPAGCEMALLFPMRSARIFASIHPSAEMTLHSFTVCAWVKVTEALEKTMVFSYGTKQSPDEIQLYFSQQSVVLVVGGSENKLVAENVISPRQWTPLCSTWSSEDGTASIWVNGESQATSTEMAKYHVIPNKGILQIGQEKNGCCVGGGFDESIAFSGKITGFNVWDTVLTKEEIKMQTSGSNSCNNRGNIVGWGITEIQAHGGATYIY